MTATTHSHPIPRFCLRRAACRALSSPSPSISFQSRPISTLKSSVLRTARPTSFAPFQSRFASGEVTQAEPEADGATEAQHGENSIAASSNEQPTEPATDSTSQQTSTQESETQETLNSADHESQSVISAMISAAGTVPNKVSETTERAAQAVGASTESVKRSAAKAAHAAGLTSSSDEVDDAKSATSNQLYIGNLFFDVSEDLIRQTMQRFGTVKSVRIIYDGRGLSKGYAYNRPTGWKASNTTKLSVGLVTLNSPTMPAPPGPSKR